MKRDLSDMTIEQALLDESIRQSDSLHSIKLMLGVLTGITLLMAAFFILTLVSAAS